MTAIFRYEVPVDDQWHTITLQAPVLFVACRNPRAVEFWAKNYGPDDQFVTITRDYIVVGTGHPMDQADLEHVGTAIATPSLVWHLMRRPLGGGEYEPLTSFNSKAGDDWRVRFSIPDVGLVDIPMAALTEVKPPLPPEPLNGSFVRAGEHYFQRDDQRLDMDHSAWWNLSDDRWSTWEQVCQLGTPVRLVPAPEPVALPWQDGPLGVSFDPRGLGGGPHKVVVVVGAHTANVTALVARAAGYAFLTAADAAEATP